MDFDQYQRYETVRELAEELRRLAQTKVLSILEVGANEHQILGQLLPNDEILYSDVELPEELLADPHFVIVDATDMAEFADEQFDLVVALDVLEHIPNENRLAMLGEMNRVARHACVVCFPYDSRANREAERRANEQYSVIFGNPHIWLLEHIKNGLPSISDTEAALESQGLFYFHFEHGDVQVWEEMIKIISYTYYTPDALPYLDSINSVYIDNLYRHDVGEDNYRTFFVSSRNAKMAKELKKHAMGLFNPPMSDKNLRFLQRCIDDLVRVCQLSIPRDNHHIAMKLYWDDGAGYTEKKSICHRVSLDESGNFEVSYELPTGVQAVRYDPVDGWACLLQGLQILADGAQLPSNVPTNGLQLGNLFFFDTTDPQFNINLPPNTQTLYFCGRIFIYRGLPQMPMLSAVHLALRRYREELDALQMNHEKRGEEIEQLKKRLSAPTLREINLQQEYQRQEQKLFELAASYNNILHSRSWRVTRPLRAVMRLLRGEPAFKTIQTPKIENPVRFCIESLSTDPPLFSVSGWAFSTNGSTDDLSLRIHCDGKDFFVETLYGLAREDVRNSWQDSNALSSGFYAAVLCGGVRKFSVYLRLRVNGKVEEVFLTKVEMPCDDTTAPSFFAMVSGTKVPATALASWVEENVLGEPILEDALYSHSVDIVVPVYNGFSYLETLFSTIPQTKMNYQLIVIDDASHDAQVWPFLQKLAEKDVRIQLHRNDENLGFVKTVNRGLALAENAVVILNTDIELPPLWLERLMRPILLDKKIASATPFTNSGTLCSFPNFGKDSELPVGLTCTQVDEIFYTLRPAYTELPTGVGFCMAMGKKALADVGFLDADTFSRGYGEENDWCQRAIQKGYRNVMVENLFVYHKHGGSFESEEKQALLEKNAKALLQKHPNYNRDVSLFFQVDPAKSFREYALISLMMKHAKAPLHLVFNHDWGGGATAYLDGWCRQAMHDGERVLLVHYNSEHRAHYIVYMQGENEARFRLEKLCDLDILLRQTSLASIRVNELVSYPDLEETLRYILAIKEEESAPLIYYMHDYYSICPTINLVDRNTAHCYLQSSADCAECLKNNPYNFYAQEPSIEKWRSMWQAFLERADDVVTFSESSVEIVRGVYPTVDTLSMMPHEVTPLPFLGRRFKTSQTINIGLMGVLTDIKGRKVLQEMLKLAEEDDRDVRFVLLGYSAVDFSSRHFAETGRYTVSRLPLLVLENDIDVIFIASVWPETFSYTTAEAIQMGLPVASFDLGAQAMHVKKAQDGLVLPMTSIEAAYEALASFAQKQATDRPRHVKNRRVLFVVEHESSSSRYRVDHFREQMILRGVLSDCVLMKNIDPQIAKNYDALVIYRCPHTPALQQMIDEAHSLGRRVFYDVDDYIFDYEMLCEMDFITTEEYKDYEGYSASIRRCMELCDAFLTSTIALADSIDKVMGKPTCVNRNVVSIEMNIASLLALPRPADGKVVLGYFSDANSHKGNLALIEPVLTKVMRENPNVLLKIVGPMEVPTSLKDFGERVLCRAFVDWRELPQLIASVDINLMPLEDSLFHRAETENLWMEAALVKVPTILSDSPELSTIIDDGENGLLCAGIAQFEGALNCLVNNADERRRIGQNAFEWVQGHCTTLVTGEEAIAFVLEK